MKSHSVGMAIPTRNAKLPRVHVARVEPPSLNMFKPLVEQAPSISISRGRQFCQDVANGDSCMLWTPSRQREPQLAPCTL